MAGSPSSVTTARQRQHFKAGRRLLGYGDKLARAVLSLALVQCTASAFLYKSSGSVHDPPDNASAQLADTLRPVYYEGEHVNVAKEAYMSSTAGRAMASRAVDRVTHGFYGEDGTTASTKVESDPFIEVDVGQAHLIAAVEVWLPKRRCDNLKFGDAKCEEIFVGSSKPLVVELMSPGDNAGARGERNVVSSRKYTSPRSVFFWDHVSETARYVRVSLPGNARRLAVTEVKVFVRDTAMSLCSPSTCAGGTCTCHGSGCSGQRCRCSPERVGEEDCGTDINRDWRYFPLPKRLDTLDARWNAGSLWDTAMSELHAVQNPKSSCSRADVRDGLIGAQAKGAGLASSLHFASGYLALAHERQRPFVFSGRLNYAGTKYCKDKGMLGDMDCYLGPVAGGSCLDLKRRERTKYRGYSGPRAHPNRCAIGKWCDDVSHFKRVPKKFQTQGLFWWRTATVAALVKMNRDTDALLRLEEVKRKIGFVSPIIGVHVRHGDACHTTARKGRCKGLASYLPELRSLRDRYQTRRVFLATDDESVIRASRRFATEFDFVFLSSPEIDRKLFDSKEQIEYRKNLWNGASNVGHKIMMASLYDMLLLGHSDYLILHLLSNMSRLALELAAARAKKVPPFSSVDGPWTNNWRM